MSYRQGYFGDKTFAKFTTADKERQLEDALMLDNPVTDIHIAMEVNSFQLNQPELNGACSGRRPNFPEAGYHGIRVVALGHLTP